MKHMNFLPEPLLEQLELNSFIKKAMSVLAIAFFVGLLFVYGASIAVSFYEKSLSDYEARLADPRFDASDALSWSRRKAEEDSLKQILILEEIDVSSLGLTDAYQIIEALPEALYAWELILTAQPFQGELQGIAMDTGEISKFVERLKSGGDMKSVQLVRLHKYSEDRTDFTVAFRWSAAEKRGFKGEEVDEP